MTLVPDIFTYIYRFILGPLGLISDIYNLSRSCHSAYVAIKQCRWNIDTLRISPGICLEKLRALASTPPLSIGHLILTTEFGSRPYSPCRHIDIPPYGTSIGSSELRVFHKQKSELYRLVDYLSSFSKKITVEIASEPPRCTFNATKWVGLCIGQTSHKSKRSAPFIGLPGQIAEVHIVHQSESELKREHHHISCKKFEYMPSGVTIIETNRNNSFRNTKHIY